ncbi:MAG: PhzF family phenazine biosynthesis protein, partial [Acidobacteria bacterium]|nr:PhzF family phenazine biosynthesis protein [Acidobacteriota bacterium]
GSLGAYLVRHGKLQLEQSLEITQGVEMGRRSEIQVVVNKEKGRLVPKVGGTAVRIVEGFLNA